MKDVKMIGVLLILLVTSYSSQAYLSGIAIENGRSSGMQVFINGRLYNKQPSNFVRIPSKPGLFYVQVKVLNPYDKEWYLVKKTIRVEKNYEFYYKIVFARGKRPLIQAMKRYPVYSRYFLNPTLYNKHPVS
jgi:hypothetical protein